MPTKWTDAKVAFQSGAQYIIPTKDTEDSRLLSAHASTEQAV
jgi:hypothetical protein